ncbi:MAG: hypothetical protein ACTSRG_13155 [Candidatus Helarchaeota archaeon]
MSIISQSKFAEKTSRTRGAINQRIKRGTLNALPNGKMDINDQLNAAFIADIELDKNIESIAEEKRKNYSVPEIEQDPLVQSSINAKRGQDVLKYKKLELEVQELEGSLIDRELIASTCFDYLSALNINMLDSPQGFVDEMESAILNELPRSEKIKILTKPITEAIELTISQVEKKLKESTGNNN